MRACSRQRVHSIRARHVGQLCGTNFPRCAAYALTRHPRQKTSPASASAPAADDDRRPATSRCSRQIGHTTAISPVLWACSARRICGQYDDDGEHAALAAAGSHSLAAAPPAVARARCARTRHALPPPGSGDAVPSEDSGLGDARGVLARRARAPWAIPSLTRLFRCVGIRPAMP
ncbi:hypothetical protein ESCO_001462 [Escovopsis weberi]|uniref:Uncharacterized protein n=1 Tax=Escovopsis weberi TaxID=150374 RepID=A0A0M8N6I3_ESCWE|nr:hypothetical protein ESCO_001462 [Escovopsis weberi]